MSLRSGRLSRVGRPPSLRPTSLRPMSLRPGTRARSMSLFVVSGLAVGGLALTGAPASGSATDGDESVSVRAIESFAPSWQTTVPASAVSEEWDWPSTDERPLVRSDVAYINAALADIDIDLTTELVYDAADGEPIDAPRIRAWLEERNSPMAPYAEELVAAGVEHDVDPRLVVGIAAIESSAGKRLPPGSHNAWGWGGNGSHGLAAWPSWPVSIDEFTEGLARVYDTDNVDETMARKYVPPNWQKWLRTVHWVIDDI